MLINSFWNTFIAVRTLKSLWKPILFLNHRQVDLLDLNLFRDIRNMWTVLNSPLPPYTHTTNMSKSEWMVLVTINTGEIKQAQDRKLSYPEALNVALWKTGMSWKDFGGSMRRWCEQLTPRDAGSFRCLWFGSSLTKNPSAPKRKWVHSAAGAGQLFFIREHLWPVFEGNFSGNSVHVDALVCHLHHTGSSAKYVCVFFLLKKRKLSAFISSSPVSIL